MRLAPYALLLSLACEADPPAPAVQLGSGAEAAQTAPAPEAAPAQSPVPKPETAPSAPRPLPRPEIVLDPLPPEERTDRDANGMRRIGAHRELPDLPPAHVAWQSGGDGAAVWRVRIQSTGAVALRLHFSGFHLSDGSVVVYEADEKLRPAGERRYEADGPADDGEFWSDLIEGDTAVVELHPGPGIKPDPIPFRIDRISHLWQSPLDAF